MKKKPIIRILLYIFAGIAAVLMLLFAVLYFSLSGNPISNWTEKQTCLTYYEKTYNTSFTVYTASYSYKRHSSTFIIGPTDNPQIKFETSTESLSTNDGYGARIACYALEQAAASVMSKSFSSLELTINAFEDPDPENMTETNPQVRLQQNGYSLYMDWSDNAITKEAADALVSEMEAVIRTELSGMTKHLDFSVMIKRESSDYLNYYKPIK